MELELPEQYSQSSELAVPGVDEKSVENPTNDSASNQSPTGTQSVSQVTEKHDLESEIKQLKKEVAYPKRRMTIRESQEPTDAMIKKFEEVKLEQIDSETVSSNQTQTEKSMQQQEVPENQEKKTTDPNKWSPEIKTFVISQAVKQIDSLGLKPSISPELDQSLIPVLKSPKTRNT